MKEYVIDDRLCGASSLDIRFSQNFKVKGNRGARLATPLGPFSALVRIDHDARGFVVCRQNLVTTVLEAQKQHMARLIAEHAQS